MKKLCAILIVLSTSLGWSLPQDDLASGDQATRDAAAKTLRITYEPIPRGKWEPLLEKIKPGMSKDAFAELLSSYHAQSEGGDSSGGSTTGSYRLDDQWLLVYYSDDRANKITGATLKEDMRNVWVEPPKKFTGTWITYFVNGQKSHEIEYKDGIYFGEFIAYHGNGTKLYVQHYDSSGCNGDDTGYFPSGKVMYQGHYKNGNQAGIWTWFKENGSVATTQDHTK